jgi:hypothetical protein
MVLRRFEEYVTYSFSLRVLCSNNMTQILLTFEIFLTLKVLVPFCDCTKRGAFIGDYLT